MRTRIVRPELLETYPDDHPDAIKGREDLLVVNAVMGNHRWMERMLRRRYQPGWRVTEIGAGDGALSLRFWRNGVCPSNALCAVDLAGRPAAWPAEAEWVQGSLLEKPLPDSQVLVANLILHHFREEQLRAMGAGISANTRLILAAEPARMRVHSWLGRALCFLADFNHVTTYDMQVSIRAGFRDDELRQELGLGPGWEVRAFIHPMGAYRFMAWR